VEKQTKTTYLLIASFVIGVIIHNFYYAIFGREDIVFFFLSLGLFLGFLLSIIYNTFTFLRKGKPKDWWKVGFLGFLGLVGFFPNFGPKFYGLYGFFGLFGFRKK
jgi:hypothetical protein